MSPVALTLLSTQYGNYLKVFQFPASLGINAKNLKEMLKDLIDLLHASLLVTW